MSIVNRLPAAEWNQGDEPGEVAGDGVQERTAKQCAMPGLVECGEPEEPGQGQEQLARGPGEPGI